MLTTVQQLWDAFWSIPHLSSYVTAAWLLYLVPLCVWIVLQKREPVATLSWLLSLAMLPYVGYLIYFLLGPQRIRRQQLRRHLARTGLDSYEVFCPTDEDCTELALLAQSTTGLPPSSATSVQLLVDGGATYESILDAVAQAQNHVHLEYYIFNPDRSGTLLRDALIERARAGVKIRLLLDAVGSSALRKRFLQPLLDAGVEFAWFHPTRLRPFKRPWVNMRTHRKIVVVDGRIAFTGGINITDEENERLRSDAYRDLHVRMEGEVVRSIQQVFVEDWVYATGHQRKDFHGTRLWSATEANVEGGIAAQALISGPDSAWEAIHRLHVAAIHEARQRVWLVTPYFVPGEAARMALTSAALGGLDVRLLVPKLSDSRLVTYAARSYFDELLAAGVKVYEYGPRLMHSKALLCDDHLAIVGSANFDHRSFRLNFEISMLFRDRTVTATLAQWLEGEFAVSQQVQGNGQRAFWRRRLPEAMARLLSPLL
ncbi:cardiolipin synthase [Pseudoxanthomonas wuyuanensis]|uniref:Cardiolipin synthase n=1 Tax=Pseudoxanthomonas wuyuanensis TaxID=1073196 RepID=A0A286DEY3_9GAMM|nr:cardiolipin synthase [Pseudoxanthomonas wuyuanensis]KAF1719900.1 cardiolipin synthase [Pseudoxanthomonas wuyuanensis]SOD57151.1 cardiolipin synthetase 2 [Pseudoxanthomonas wuyuanensis]